LTYFVKAKHLAPSNDDSSGAIADLFSGTIKLNQGHLTSAKDFLKSVDVQKQVSDNPYLMDFTASEFCTKHPCVAYLGQTFKAERLSPN